MGVRERCAVVVVRENGECAVLVPSADRPFCEEVAVQFNYQRSDGLRAAVAPHLLGRSYANGGLSALLGARRASTQKKPSVTRCHGRL